MQIVVQNLSLTDINSAFLRIGRLIDQKAAEAKTGAIQTITQAGNAGFGSIQKYDDSALKNEQARLAELINNLQQSLQRVDIRSTTNYNKILELAGIVSNIDIWYDKDTNSLHFTDSTGVEEVIPLTETTYTFSYNESTCRFTIKKVVNDGSGSPTETTVLDKVFKGRSYSLSLTNDGKLKFRDNLEASETTIDLTTKYYTKSDIQALVLDLIPAGATSANKLVTQSQMDDAIATSTATFRGTFDTYEQLVAYSGPKDANDYAYVYDGTDYERYKYVPSGGSSGGGSWVYEYTLHTSGSTLSFVYTNDATTRPLILGASTSCSSNYICDKVCYSPKIYAKASTGDLVACCFIGNVCGNISGVAAGADCINKYWTNTVADMAIPLVAGSNGYGKVFVSCACGITFNPATGTLCAKCFTGSVSTSANVGRTGLDCYANADYDLALFNGCDTTSCAPLYVARDCRVRVNPYYGLLTAKCFDATANCVITDGVYTHVPTTAGNICQFALGVGCWPAGSTSGAWKYFMFCGNGFMYGNVCGCLCGTANNASYVQRRQTSNSENCHIALWEGCSATTTGALYAAHACCLLYNPGTGNLQTCKLTACCITSPYSIALGSTNGADMYYRICFPDVNDSWANSQMIPHITISVYNSKYLYNPQNCDFIRLTKCAYGIKCIAADYPYIWIKSSDYRAKLITSAARMILVCCTTTEPSGLTWKSADYIYYSQHACDADKLGGRNSTQYIRNCNGVDLGVNAELGSYHTMTQYTGIDTCWRHVLSLGWGNNAGTDTWAAQLSLPTYYLNSSCCHIYWRTHNSCNASGCWNGWNQVIDNIGGQTIKGNLTLYNVTNPPILALQGCTAYTAGSVLDGPSIKFSNTNASQNGTLVFNDYDVYACGASLTFATDQPQTWFLTERIRSNQLIVNAIAGSYNEGLRINRAPNSCVAQIYLGASPNTNSGNEANSFWIGTIGCGTDANKLWISYCGSRGNSYFCCSGSGVDTFWHGNVTGNVTGNLTGNVTGDVTGNLTGNVCGNVNGNVTGNVTGTSQYATCLGDATNYFTYLGLACTIPRWSSYYTSGQVNTGCVLLVQACYGSTGNHDVGLAGTVYVDYIGAQVHCFPFQVYVRGNSTTIGTAYFRLGCYGSTSYLKATRETSGCAFIVRLYAVLSAFNTSYTRINTKIDCLSAGDVSYRQRLYDMPYLSFPNTVVSTMSGTEITPTYTQVGCSRWSYCTNIVERCTYSNAYDFDVLLTNGITSTYTQTWVSTACRLRYCNTTGCLRTNIGSFSTCTITPYLSATVPSSASTCSNLCLRAYRCDTSTLYCCYWTFCGQNGIAYGNFSNAYDMNKNWQIVDLSDTSTWNVDTVYPVTFGLGVPGAQKAPVRVQIAVNLDTGCTACWMNHSLGFTLDVDLTTNANGWGTAHIFTHSMVHCNWIKNDGKQLFGYEQMTNSDTGVFYLRGGGKYRVWASNAATFIPRCCAYTNAQQTVCPINAACSIPKQFSSYWYNMCVTCASKATISCCAEVVYRTACDSKFPLALVCNTSTICDANIMVSSTYPLYAEGSTGRLYACAIHLKQTDGNSSAGYLQSIGKCGSYDALVFLNNTNDSYGNGILADAGGITIVGAGESGCNLWYNLNGAQCYAGARAGDECLFLTSDNNIYVDTNAQNSSPTSYSANRWIFCTNGELYKDGDPVPYWHGNKSFMCLCDAGFIDTWVPQGCACICRRVIAGVSTTNIGYITAPAIGWCKPAWGAWGALVLSVNTSDHGGAYSCFDWYDYIFTNCGILCGARLNSDKCSEVFISAECYNELNIRPASGNTAWINYRGGVCNLYIGSGFSDGCCGCLYACCVISNLAGTANNANCMSYTGYGTSAVTAVQTCGSWAGSPSEWASYLIFNHGNGSNYYHQTLRMPFWETQVPQYQRMVGGTNNAWHNFITDENIATCLNGWCYRSESSPNMCQYHTMRICMPSEIMSVQYPIKYWVVGCGASGNRVSIFIEYNGRGSNTNGDKGYISACYGVEGSHITVPYRVSLDEPNRNIYIDFATCSSCAGYNMRFILNEDLDMPFGPSYYSHITGGSIIVNENNGKYNCVWATSLTINTSVPENQVLFNNLSANVVTTSCLATTSALARKKNITPFTDCALNILRSTDIVNYLYKEENNTCLRHVGFIADYTCKLLSGANQDQMRINDSIGILMKAVKELDDKVNKPWFIRFITNIIKKIGEYIHVLHL